jgi:hypothetical protein
LLQEFFLPVHDLETDKLTVSVYDSHANRSMIGLLGGTLKHVKNMLLALARINRGGHGGAHKEFDEKKHVLLAEKMLDIGATAFTGSKQRIILDAAEGQTGSVDVVLVGKVFHLKNFK